MGKRGPAPEPTNLVALKGGKVDSAEPVPADVPVEPPYRLTKAVQEIWDRLAPDRIDKGLLTAWDVDAFTAFCELLALNQQAFRSAHRGVLVPGSRGDERVYNRAMQGVRETTQLLATLGGRFGWTPSDRRDLMVEQEKASDKERLLS